MEPVLATVGICLFVVGGLVTSLNFFLSVLRFPLHALRGGTVENYRHISGLPLIGSLLLWGSAVLLRENPIAVWSALALSLFDTAGLHWFIGVMIYVCCVQEAAKPTDNRP